MIEKIINKIKQKLEVSRQLRAAYKEYKIKYPNGTYQGFSDWLDGRI